MVAIFFFHVIYRGRRKVDNNNFGKGNYMQVNGINSYSAPKVSFGTDSVEDKKNNKKAIAAAGVGAAAVAAGTIAYAAKRGSLITPENTKFFTKIKEGFKSFAGENRVKYLGKVKENLEDMVENGKKAKDGTFTKLSEDAINKTKAKIDKIGEKINALTEKLAQKAQKAADKTAEAASEAAQNA